MNFENENSIKQEQLSLNPFSQEFCEDLVVTHDFQLKNSGYLTEINTDIDKIRQEYDIRKQFIDHFKTLEQYGQTQFLEYQQFRNAPEYLFQPLNFLKNIPESQIIATYNSFQQQQINLFSSIQQNQVKLKRNLYFFTEIDNFLKKTDSDQEIVSYSDSKQLKPPKNLISPEKEIPPVGCNCRKTKCLKLYCECFANQQKCLDTCRCMDCLNTSQHPVELEKAIQDAINRNKDAFTPKKELHKVQDIRKGCSCKKTKCLKKYCECFNSGFKCSSLCKCDNCSNGPKVQIDNHENIQPQNIENQQNSSNNDDKMVPEKSPQISATICNSQEAPRQQQQKVLLARKLFGNKN